MKSWNAWLVITLIGLGIFTTVGKSLAWEFSMDGQFNWEYDLRGQTGSNGFFGPYDVDAGSGATYTPGTVTPVLVPGSSQAPAIMNSVVQNAITPGAATAYGAGYFAPLNFWMGFNLPGNDQNLTTSGSSFTSGSNGSWNTVYMDTLMDLHFNKAVRVRGRYHIGQWQTPGISTSPGETVASQYLMYHANGIQRSISPGYWNTLWIAVQLPWGHLSLGKKPMVLGTGLGFNGEENRNVRTHYATNLLWPYQDDGSLCPLSARNDQFGVL